MIVLHENKLVTSVLIIKCAYFNGVCLDYSYFVLLLSVLPD